MTHIQKNNENITKNGYLNIKMTKFLELLKKKTKVLNFGKNGKISEKNVKIS
jgi:hypothetical protein